MERLTTTSNKGGVALAFDLDITCNKSEIMKLMKLTERLKEYEDLEEQGKLLKLPCAVGDTVYCIYNKYTKCIEYGQRFSAHNCEGCPAKCDSKEEYYIEPKKVYNLDWIVAQIKHFGKRVFLTKEAAEVALKEMTGKG